MANNDMVRLIQKLGNIDNSLGALVKVLETFNENFVAFAKTFNDQGVDLDKLAEDVNRLRKIKKGTDEAVEIRPFDLRDTVRVIDEHTIMHNRIGTVVMTAADGTVEVEFNDGKTGAEYSYRQLEKVPFGTRDEPSETISIHQGRMHPSEWRHTLGINDIRVMKPDTAMVKLSANENRPMTRSQFDLYNTELYATGVIMNEEDAEGIPDERGRLKPREWRGHFGMPKFDPPGTSHEFNENRLMTDDTFWAYHAKLNTTGVTKTDAQGKKVPAETLDDRWKSAGDTMAEAGKNLAKGAQAIRDHLNKKVPADQHGLDKTVQIESSDQSWRGDF